MGGEGWKVEQRAVKGGTEGETGGRRGDSGPSTREIGGESGRACVRGGEGGMVGGVTL